PLLGSVSNDRFNGLVLSNDVQVIGYNFGERGLRSPTKAMELASTPSPIDLLKTIMAADEPATLEAQYDPPVPAAVVAHQNPTNSLDVSGDGLVTPLDALMVINALNAQLGTHPQAAALASAAPSAPYYDTNGDSLITPADALRVIN